RPHVSLTPHPAAVVYLEEPAGSRSDAQGVEAESIEARRPPGRDDESCARQPRSVAQEETRGVRSQLRPDDLAAQTYVDAVLTKDVGKRAGHGRLFRRNQTRRPLDDRDLRPEPRQDLGDLASLRSAAEYDHGIRALCSRVD